ncbi:MAG: 4Fe-4S binding protein [Promethearchaeota archaeon]
MNVKKFNIKDHRITLIRRIVQIFAFIVINYVIIEFIFSVNLKSFEGFFKVLPVLNSPRNPLSKGAGILEYIFYFMVEGVFPLFLIAILILIFLFSNRFFCGWICPIGAIQDACAAIPTKNKKTVSTNTHKTLLKLKSLVLILLIIITLPLVFTKITDYEFYLEYKENLGILGQRPVGHFSLSEFIFVFFPNLIKDCIEKAGIEPLFADFWTFFILIFYIVIIITSIWYPRVYCKYLCPFGAVASIVCDYSFLKLTRSPVKCIGRAECGKCEQICPKQVRILDEPFEFFTGSGECNLCLKCKEACPYDAIEIKFI